jgi:hypothetical protein
MQIQDEPVFPFIYAPMLATVERKLQHPRRHYQIELLLLVDG